MINKSYHKKNLKEAILALTIHYIKKEGYQSISIRKLAKDLDVSPTAIYRHYSNLENLFEQSIVFLSQEFTDYLQSSYEHNQLFSPIEELEIIGFHFVKYAVDSKNEFDFLFLSDYSLQNVFLEKDVDSPLLVLMALVIERLKKSYELTIDKQLLFTQLWCFIFGYAVLVSKQELELDKSLINATIKRLLNQ